MKTDKTLDSIVEKMERQIQAFEQWRDKRCKELLKKVKENSQSCDVHSHILEPDLDRSAELSYERADDQYTLIYKPCPICVQVDEKRREVEYWNKKGVPNKVAGATVKGFLRSSKDDDAQKSKKMKAYKEAIIGWVSEPKPPTFLFLSGKPGTGKSHMAAALFKHRHREGKSVIWIRWSDLVRQHRAGYDNPKLSGVILNKVRAVDFLVVDEAIPCKGGDEYEIWMEIIEKRHDLELPTVITSNNTEESFYEHCLSHGGAEDRFKTDSLILLCDWRSYR